VVRRLLLVLTAVVTSYGLTAATGYLLYTYAAGQSEYKLSVLVRVLLNPLIAVATGALVGILSKDNPVLPTIAGLLPWSFGMGAAHISISVWSSLITLVELMPLAVISALYAFRCRRSRRFPTLPSIK
jgi:hypothetical protein